ncbi:serine hydrolase domain-containing protein [Pukyongia salina]|nr:serine hydrolase domain-containing protein [Pukyongia salina]
MKTRTLVYFISFLFFYQANNAQILDKIKKVKNTVAKTISLDKLKQDPITTSFNDVDRTKYLEDDFGNDAVFKNIHDQPYSWENGFFLAPGFYEGYFNSFCIKAGTYAPQRGDGRFYAELKGPKADIIEAIIEGYQKNPDITQKEVQLLLWAIVAKTDFQKMKGEVKVIAIKLLTPEQLARLSTNALESYASNEIKKIAKKNETLRYILEAENNLRRKFYQGVSDYEEYEKIAMRAGVEPAENIYNKGRWTKHPNGFFIRYNIQSYRGTKTQIYVPEDDIEAFQPIKGKGPSINEPYPIVNGKYYKSRNSIATPSNPYAQRIIQTDIEPGSTGGPGTGGPNGNGGSGNDEDNGNENDQGGGQGGGSDNQGGNEDQNTNDDQSGGQDGSDDQGSGSGENNDSGGVLPSDNQETNAFECEEVINPIADKSIRLEMLNQNIPGALVCVFKGDSIIHMKAYGKMRLNHPLTLNTKLQWASISKSVTAVAAIQMVEEGRLKLSDSPSQLLSYWPNNVEVKDINGKKLTEDRYANITLRHLLNNSSGIQHYGRGKNESQVTTYKNRTVKFANNVEYTPLINGGYNAKSSVSQFNKSVLDFDPGKDYLYSSYGFNLAGAMIDSKIHFGYDSWVKKHISVRLGLRNFDEAKGAKNRYGYQVFEDGIYSNEPLGDYDHVLPSGGWESTICDLATFARALSRGELIKEKDALWKNSNVLRGYGFGLNRAGTGNDTRVFHGGTNKGSRAYLLFFPSDETGIVILAPFAQAELERMARNLVEDLKIRPGLYSSEKKPMDKCRRGMKSDKDLFIGVWRKTGNEQIIRTGLELAEFRDEIKIMRDYGYHLDDFEIHVTNDHKQIYDGVFKKGRKIQVLVTGKGYADMLQEVNRFRSQNLEIVDVEYGLFDPSSDDLMLNSSLNALFEKGAPLSTLESWKTQSEFVQLVTDYKSNNLKIIDVEGHPNRDQTIFTGLFVKGTGNNLLIETPTKFMEGIQAGSYASYGKLLDVDMFLRGDDPKARFVISIWEPSNTNMLTSYDTAKQPALDFCTFMDMHEDNRNNGYELIDLDRIFTHVK